MGSGWNNAYEVPSTNDDGWDSLLEVLKIEQPLNQHNIATDVNPAENISSNLSMPEVHQNIIPEGQLQASHHEAPLMALPDHDGEYWGDIADTMTNIDPPLSILNDHTINNNATHLPANQYQNMVNVSATTNYLNHMPANQHQDQIINASTTTNYDGIWNALPTDLISDNRQNLQSQREFHTSRVVNNMLQQDFTTSNFNNHIQHPQPQIRLQQEYATTNFNNHIHHLQHQTGMQRDDIWLTLPTYGVSNNHQNLMHKHNFYANQAVNNGFITTNFNNHIQHPQPQTGFQQQQFVANTMSNINTFTTQEPLQSISPHLAINTNEFVPNSMGYNFIDRYLVQEPNRFMNSPPNFSINTHEAFHVPAPTNNSGNLLDVVTPQQQPFVLSDNYRSISLAPENYLVSQMELSHQANDNIFMESASEYQSPQDETSLSSRTKIRKRSEWVTYEREKHERNARRRRRNI
ncbi:hypothetical protein ACFE04_013859 [Oxalis oulophora]